MPRKLLMIPGPSETDPNVLPVMAQPSVAHYGKDWYQRYLGILEKLRQVFGTTNDVLIIPAPGSAAIEMAASNILEPGDKAAVVVNGFFGELAKLIVESYGGIAVPINVQYGKPVDLTVARQAFEDGDVKALFIVHNDTSTGTFSPIMELAAIAKEHGALVIVDAVSSFGGMELDLDGWGVDFCVGYASKALGGAAGATPVAISESVWQASVNRKVPVPGRLLNLTRWREAIDKWSDWGHPYPTTQSTPLILAMEKALDIALEEGLEKRYARHKKVARSLREAWKAMGLGIFADESIASNTLSVLNVPPGMDEKIRETMYNRYDIMISMGFGKLRGNTVRVGHMGTSASYGHITQTIAALGGSLSSLGISDKGADGLRVATEILNNSA